MRHRQFQCRLNKVSLRQLAATLYEVQLNICRLLMSHLLVQPQGRESIQIRRSMPLPDHGEVRFTKHKEGRCLERFCPVNRPVNLQAMVYPTHEEELLQKVLLCPILIPCLAWTSMGTIYRVLATTSNVYTKERIVTCRCILTLHIPIHHQL